MALVFHFSTYSSASTDADLYLHRDALQLQKTASRFPDFRRSWWTGRDLDPRPSGALVSATCKPDVLRPRFGLVYQAELPAHFHLHQFARTFNPYQHLTTHLDTHFEIQPVRFFPIGSLRRFTKWPGEEGSLRFAKWGLFISEEGSLRALESSLVICSFEASHLKPPRCVWGVE